MQGIREGKVLLHVVKEFSRQGMREGKVLLHVDVASFVTRLCHLSHCPSGLETWLEEYFVQRCHSGNVTWRI